MMIRIRTLKRLAAAVLATAAALASAAEEPLAELPYTPGLDLKAMDTGASPCVDFYQYACGGWLKSNPIPADKARWEVYSKMAEENKRFLWGILDALSRQAEGRSQPQQQIGDLFAACMDERAIESAGAAPLKPWLQRIDALGSIRELPVLLAELHLATADPGFLFSFGQGQDFGDSTRVIAFVGSGGISLPDRDYYLKADARMRGMRSGFVAHVAQMFQQLGSSPADAQRDAQVVLKLETELARHTLTKVQQREPKRLHNKFDATGLRKLSPRFDWGTYLRALGVAELREFNVTEPAFVRAVDQLLRSRPLPEIKTYLRWHLAHSMANVLSEPFVQADFSFFSKTLRGIPELSPRWQRCVTFTDQLLGEALGQEFVRRAFSPEQKRQTQHMTERIEQAMAAEIRALDWMSGPTKKKALEKLATIVNKIGYPERWRDYGPVRIARDDFVGDVVRAVEFEQRRQLAKIGQPVDREEWGMTPPTVNAYYDAQKNEINFPAGILQPPLFDPKMDDAPNYGNTGSTIGHELTHGFDDEGRQFDARGNLKNWWAPSDEKAFNQRTQCLVDQYAKYTIVDDIRINSRLTLGEDLADLGGTVLALIAWKMEVTTKGLPPDRDGFTPIQRFFIGLAQWACENVRPEEARVKALTDPHSPGRWRVNGLVVNFPEFEQAFACKPGQPMAPVKRCKVW